MVGVVIAHVVLGVLYVELADGRLVAGQAREAHAAPHVVNVGPVNADVTLVLVGRKSLCMGLGKKEGTNLPGSI